MKKLIKLLSIFTLILVCSFNFIACSNNESKQTTQISTNNISDTGTNQEENSADNVTDEDEDSDFPIKIGIYKFDKEVLNFKDAYYKNEQELFDFFKTKDLNGVYAAAIKNGFNEFAKSITTFTIEDTDVKFAISFNKNESDGSQLGLLKLYEIPKNNFILESEQIVYDVVDNKIISQEHLPEINVDPETKKVSLSYQFSYVDSETSETIYTPLYIKADLTLYNAIDIFQESNIKQYFYVEDSAKLITTDDSLDKDALTQELIELLETESLEPIFNMLESTDIFTKNNDTYYFNINENILYIPERIENTNKYTNGDYELEITIDSENPNILNFSAKIKENVYFVFEFELDK